MLLFNGSTGYLECNSKIVGTYPMSMICFGTRLNSATEQYWVAQSQSNGDRIIAGRHIASSDTKNLRQIEPGQSRGVSKTAAPHTSSTVPQLLAVVLPSAGVRQLYFADGTMVSDTNATNDGITNHNLSTIGGYRYNSTAAAGFANGSLAEAHWYNVALTSQNVIDIIAGTFKPEEITGWVDGLTMKDYEASGTYTTISGTRTFTAIGGVSASSVTHPVSRVTGIALNAAATAAATATSALTTSILVHASAVAIATSTANLTDNGFAATALASASATANISTGILLVSSGISICTTTAALTTSSVKSFSTPPLKNNAGTVLANKPGIVVNVYSATTGALLFRKTALTSDSNGVVLVSDVSLTTGTFSYEVVTPEDGRRLPTATVV